MEEEVAIPQVKTLYRYQGQGMGFSKGETFILVSKKNKDWWAVRYVRGYNYHQAGHFANSNASVTRDNVHTTRHARKRLCNFE